MNLFDGLLGQFQASALAAFDAREDRNEARSDAIAKRSGELFRTLALTNGKTSAKAMDEAIGDMCCKPDLLARLAELHDARDHAEAGRLLFEHFDRYWEARCDELAEDQIDAEDKQAAESAAADLFYARSA